MAMMVMNPALNANFARMSVAMLMSAIATVSVREGLFFWMYCP